MSTGIIPDLKWKPKFAGLCIVMSTCIEGRQSVSSVEIDQKSYEMPPKEGISIGAGGPPLAIFACAIPAEGAPSLRFLQGWRRCHPPAMLRVLFDFVADT